MDANTVCAQLAWHIRASAGSHHIISQECAEVLCRDWKRADELGVRFGACWVWFGGHSWLLESK